MDDRAPFDAIAIGSSTGGPQALVQFFTELQGVLEQPVFVTQHMPGQFTAILAENISRRSGLACREAVEGEIVAPGRIYLAPGDYHLTVRQRGDKKLIRLKHDAPVNFCRPSIDPMLKSMIEVYGGRVLAVILTGMGTDGLASCRALKEAGGTVIAQDLDSSVVWGMPGAVVKDGICEEIVALGDMAAVVRRYAGKGKGRA